MIRGQVDAAPAGDRGHPDLQRRERLRLGLLGLPPGLAGGRRRRRATWRSCLGAEKLTHEDKTRGDGGDRHRGGRRAAGGDGGRARLGRRRAAASARSSWTSTPAWRATTCERSGRHRADFAEVVVKNQHNGARNPRAQYGERADRGRGAGQPDGRRSADAARCARRSPTARRRRCSCPRARRHGWARRGPVRACARRSWSRATATTSRTRLPAPRAGRRRWPTSRPASGPDELVLRGGARRQRPGRADDLRADRV